MNEGLQHEDLTLREVPEDILRGAKDLAEEAKNINEEMETGREKFRGFLARVEAYNRQIEDFIKSLAK